MRTDPSLYGAVCLWVMPVVAVCRPPVPSSHMSRSSVWTCDLVVQSSSGSRPHRKASMVSPKLQMSPLPCGSSTSAPPPPPTPTPTGTAFVTQMAPGPTDSQRAGRQVWVCGCSTTHSSLPSTRVVCSARPRWPPRPPCSRAGRGWTSRAPWPARSRRAWRSPWP